MKIILSLFVILIIASTGFALENERYLPSGKVVYEEPQEDQVLTVHTAYGFSTVLAFPDKPTMISTGDSSLLQVEIAGNSKDVLIKPLNDTGETNLFVFTQRGRFNFRIVISDFKNLDYVIDVRAQYPETKSQSLEIPVLHLIKMAKNYSALKALGMIKDRNLIQRDLFSQFKDFKGLRIKAIEAFSRKVPHYLILHIVVQNIDTSVVQLNERHTNVYVNGQRFQPAYVFFDNPLLNSNEVTDGWLILENTFVSFDNVFTFGIGIGDQEYVFNEILS